MIDSLFETLLELSPWFLLGMAVAGVLHIVLPRNFIKTQLRGRWGVVKAVALGVPLPLCSCGVIPTGLGLRRDGASNGASLGFLISTPQTGVDSILVSASFLGWPYSSLDDYIRCWDVDYYQVMSKIPKQHMLFDIQACFQIAHGSHLRREAILWQKVVDHKGLLRLLSSETAPEHKGPDSYMMRALKYRDDWQSRLLRTSAWSPLY